MSHTRVLPCGRPIPFAMNTIGMIRCRFGRLCACDRHEPDRRIQRAGVEVVAEALADGKTEVSVLLPRIQRERIWHKLLHDRTADALASEISDLPHANVTFEVDANTIGRSG